MDQTLAQIYGTNQPEGEEAEKLAAAELATQLAAGGELDLNTLTDEQVESLASQVLEAEGGGEAAPAGDPNADAQEKVAEADMLGRVMAHAYVQELRGIEKEAGAKEMGGKVLAHLKAARSRVAGSAPVAKGKELGKKIGEHVARHGKKYTAGAAGAAGAAGGYVAGKHKESSALDVLAERRAIEICEANGIDPSTLTPVETETVKTSAPAAEVLDAAVTQRAAEMLAQYGVEVSVEAAE